MPAWPEVASATPALPPRMRRAPMAGVTIDESPPPAVPSPWAMAMLLPPTARPMASPPMERANSLALPAVPDTAVPHSRSRLSPPMAVPNAVPPPTARVMSEASPPAAATAVPVASPPPMAIVVSCTSRPPVAHPVADPPPMAIVRLEPEPPVTVTPAVASQRRPTAML